MTALNGRIDFKAQRAVFAPWLVAQRLSGVARFNGAEVVFEDIAGELGKGQFEGRLSVSNGAAGLTAKLGVGLTDADLGAIFASAERPATAGRMALHAELEGSGRSPAAFIGSLSGFGTVTLDQARLVGLNPGVFGAVTRAVELGIPTDGNRIRDFVTGALDSAGLPVSKASAAISINEGQARLRDVVIRADGADLHATVNVDLADAMLDALLTLDALPQAAGAASPAVMISLKGTLPAPKRVIDTNLLSSWLTLRALEQQSRQIDAMERAAREAAAAAAAAPKDAEPTGETPAAAPSLVPESAGRPAPSPGWDVRGCSGAVAAGHDPGDTEAAPRAAPRPHMRASRRPARRQALPARGYSARRTDAGVRIPIRSRAAAGTGTAWLR